MQVLRFMSLDEFEKYRAGEILTNEIAHQAHTNAIGFCFLDENDYSAPAAYEFMSGIVSAEICAVFECKDIFNHTNGRYADPYGSFFQSMGVEELCTTEYSNQQLKLVKFCDTFADKYEENSSRHVFDWKKPTEPVRRKIEVVDKNPPSRFRSSNLDPVEQKFMNAIKDYLLAKAPGMPADMFDGYMVNGSPTVEYSRDFDRDTLRIEGLEFIRPGSMREFRL